MSPQDEFLRTKAIQWLGKFLGISDLPNAPLEDLLMNCWLLGRVADKANAMLVGKPYSLPPSYLPLGHRPPKQTTSDIDRFQRLCDMLDIDTNVQISLADLGQTTSANRAASCLWDVADALRRSGFDGIPRFATSEERAQFRRVGVSNADKVQKFDTQNSPLKLPHNPHLVNLEAAVGTSSDGNNSNPPSLNRWLSPAEQQQHRFIPTNSNEAPAIPIGQGSSHPDDDSDVVANILSPAKSKAGHSQLMNAIMHTHDGSSTDRPQSGNYLKVISAKPALPKELENTLDKVTKAITELNDPDVKKDWKSKALVVGGVTLAAVAVGFILGAINKPVPRSRSWREEEGERYYNPPRVAYTDLPRVEIPEARNRKNAPKHLQRR